MEHSGAVSGAATGPGEHKNWQIAVKQIQHYCEVSKGLHVDRNEKIN